MNDHTTIVSVKLPNGAIVGVEATVIGDLAEGVAPQEDRRIALHLPSLHAVTNAIEGMASVLWESLKKVGPQKATIEFGFEIGVANGELTGYFVKGTGKTNLKVTLEWSGDQEK